MRYEAYDDMLWVVLGWLEAIQFVNTHSDLHYSPSSLELSGITPGIIGGRHDGYTGLPNQPYHGNTWIPAFSHRARIFWDLASHGWDTELCGGGMLWNPRLLPYKNAITNELYIAASISMYLHFPGDDNASPFRNRTDDDRFNPEDPDAEIPSGRRDARYLKAAVDGYRWLRNVNMTNSQGLVVDGFHISGYLDENDNNTRCDARSEAVFSYNQGVVLTGQRGLWDATGAPSFLKDGHRLVQSVIRATGYDLALDRPIDDLAELKAGVLPRWHGLGRLGVMEEYVDASGTASQDVQTFKGIFFHHLAAFCAPLTWPGPDSGAQQQQQQQVHGRAFAAVKKTHAEACKSYSGWLEHNVQAALGTRDASGRFGQWWTAGLLARDWVGPWPTLDTDGIDDTPNGTVYRDHAAPEGTTTWRREGAHKPTPTPMPAALPHVDYGKFGQVPIARGPDGSISSSEGVREQQHRGMGMGGRGKDPNDRGRGRTVETQSGGLGLLRAYWKITRAL